MSTEQRDLPLVSIVVPAYNGEKYLRESVQSILDQSYPNIELLVFDDGSTDQTIELLKEYGDRFYWESHENIGQAATLNKGWKLANGQFLSYLSVDDILEPDAVNASINFLLEHPDTVMTYGDYNLIDDQGGVIKEIKTLEFDYRELVSKVVVQPGPGVFFRKDGFLKIGGWDASLRQMPDLDYWLRLGLLGNFKRIPLTIARFRVHGGSISYASSSVEQSEECPKILQRYFSNQELSLELKLLENLALSNAHLISARLHIRSGRYRMGLKHAFKAITKNKKTLLSFWTYKLLFSAVKYRVLGKFKQVVNDDN